MDSGRMPASDVVPCSGAAYIASGSDTLIGRDVSHNLLNKQVFATGNRCAHDKDNFKRPAFYGNSKKRPHVLEEAKRRIDAAVLDNFRYPMYSGLFYHQDQDGNGTGRHIRSERIEGVHGLALPTLIQNLNLQRMACGNYDNRNQFRYYNYAYIENQTDQSSIRVKREMKLLQDRGVIKVIAIREQNNDGSWRTPEVRIEFTDKIFEMLELIPEFLRDRETSAIKFHEKQSRLDKNQKKKDLYRKTTFSPDRHRNKANLKPNLTSQLQSTLKRVPVAQRGRGAAIKARLDQLVYQGKTLQQAADILKQEFPPPS